MLNTLLDDRLGRIEGMIGNLRLHGMNLKLANAVMEDIQLLRRQLASIKLQEVDVTDDIRGDDQVNIVAEELVAVESSSSDGELLPSANSIVGTTSVEAKCGESDGTTEALQG